MKKAIKTTVVALAVVMVLGAGAFAWLKLSPRRVPEGQPPLSTLEAGSLADFRATFNAAEGEIRVLALLSPT